MILRLHGEALSFQRENFRVQAHRFHLQPLWGPTWSQIGAEIEAKIFPKTSKFRVRSLMPKSLKYHSYKEKHMILARIVDVFCHRFHIDFVLCWHNQRVMCVIYGLNSCDKITIQELQIIDKLQYCLKNDKKIFYFAQKNTKRTMSRSQADRNSLQAMRSYEFLFFEKIKWR